MNDPNKHQSYWHIPRNRVLLWLGVGLVCLSIVFKHQFHIAIVVGESMIPTFNSWDVLIVNKKSYRNADPQRGDIVIAHRRNELIVKRVVGLPGETVAVRKGILYVNGTRIPEQYILTHRTLDIGMGMLFPGKFALLGDNRDLPACLTVHTIATRNQILGKVCLSIHFGQPIARSDS